MEILKTLPKKDRKKTNILLLPSLKIKNLLSKNLKNKGLISKINNGQNYKIKLIRGYLTRKK